MTSPARRPSTTVKIMCFLLLSLAGLTHLAGLGITVGMLYTDATNVAAVALYRSLGFTIDHIDRSYRREPTG